MVRTESQLARFNTARALFEKLGGEKEAPAKGTGVEKTPSGRSSRLNSEGSRHSHYSSRSPSPLAASERHQSAPGVRSARSPSPGSPARGSSVDTVLRAPVAQPKPTNGHAVQNNAPVVQVRVVDARMTPPNNAKPELPAKPERARISSKELIEKQKNWIQHFKGSVKPAVTAKPLLTASAEANNRINSERKTPSVDLKERDAWVKERNTLLTGWMASPGVTPPSSVFPAGEKQREPVREQPKDGFSFMSTRQRFEAQSKTPEPAVSPRAERLNESVESRSSSRSSSRVADQLNESFALSKSPDSTAQESDDAPRGADLVSTDSGIVVQTPDVKAEERVERPAEERDDVRGPEAVMDDEKRGEKTPPPAGERAVQQLNSSLPESEEVFYDNSVTSAGFNEWSLRTPTQLDDSPVTLQAASLDFDALVADADDVKQLEPDDEELFRTSSELSESDLSPLSSPPPEFRKEDAEPALPPSNFFFLINLPNILILPFIFTRNLQLFILFIDWYFL